MRPRRRGLARARTAHRWLLAALAVVAGGVTGLGFPPFNVWWSVPIGLASFVLLTRMARPGTGALRGYLYGFGFNVVVIHWVYVALGLPVLLVFVAWLAVWQAAVGLVIAATRRTPVWGWCGMAAWMAAEWGCARWPIGGFGWARLAFSAADSPLNGLFPFISATGVSAVIVVIGFLIAWLAWPLVARFGVDGTRADRLATPRVRTMAVVTLAGVVVGSGLLGLAGRTYDPAPDGREITVAVVQGNVPGVGTSALGPRYTVENNHLAQTILLAAKIRTGQVEQPDFVLWPENSTATDPFTDPTTTGIIIEALDLVGAPILVGSIIAGPGPQERQTVGLWWTTDGQVEAQYAKRNLVPFGEWIPGRSWLVPLIPQLTMVGAQSVPGTTPGVLDVAVSSGPLRVGDVICFEVSYDQTFDEMILGDRGVGGGAQIVTVQTSNAMFTGSDQMAQQDQITRIRAMESRREILVATTNSLAGLIDSHGQIVYEAQLRTADAQVFTVPTRSVVTWAVAARSWFDLASVVLPVLGAIIVAVALRRRARA